MTSQRWKQTTVVQILSNTSKSKGDQKKEIWSVNRI